MAGPFLPRWLGSWLGRWFAGRVRMRRQPVVRSVRPTLTILEDRASPTAIGAQVDIAPPPPNCPA